MKFVTALSAALIAASRDAASEMRLAGAADNATSRGPMRPIVMDNSRLELVITGTPLNALEARPVTGFACAASKPSC